MKNSYYINSPVVSLDLDSSWASRSWDLSQWVLQDSYKLRLQNKAVELKKEEAKSGGKVRHLFEERRGAGRDRSYPLEPLKRRVVSLDRLNYRSEAREAGDKNGERLVRSHKVTSSRLPVPSKDVDGSLRRSPQKARTETKVAPVTTIKKIEPLKPQDDLGTRFTRPVSTTKRDTSGITKLRSVDVPISRPSPASNSTDNVTNKFKDMKLTTTVKKPESKANAQTSSHPSESPKPRPTPAPNDGRVPCKNCQRLFMPDRIPVHENICKKSKNKKRKQFDPVKHRLTGTEAESYIKTIKQSINKPQPSAGATKSNWRKKHEEFINNIRAAKEAQAYVAKGGKLSDLPPPPPLDTSDYTPCPHCGRKFNSSAAERHIPKCASMRHNKTKPAVNNTRTSLKIKR